MDNLSNLFINILLLLHYRRFFFNFDVRGRTLMAVIRLNSFSHLRCFIFHYIEAYELVEL